MALAAGPLLGVALIFTTSMPLAFLNVVAGVVYALALPFVALVTAYVYFDARARGELEPADDRKELPAEDRAVGVGEMAQPLPGAHTATAGLRGKPA